MNSTSEVGYNLNAEQQEKAYNNLKILFERQSLEFQKLLQTIKTPTTNLKIKLPQFNPDQDGMDAHAWIATASLCVKDEPLQGAPLIIALSQALKGQAALWLAQISYPGMTWDNFETLFISRFTVSETLPAFMINMNQSKPNHNESIAAYAGRLVTSVMAKWKDQTVEQIAVASVLAHVSQFEPEIQRIAYTTEITSRNQMQQELKALMFIRKRPALSRTDEGLKIPKLEGAMNYSKCYNCGKMGHKAFTCRVPESDGGRPFSSTNSGDNGCVRESKATITCCRCGEEDLSGKGSTRV